MQNNGAPQQPMHRITKAGKHKKLKRNGNEITNQGRDKGGGFACSKI